MSTASLYCDDKITLNQHDELTLFLGCEELSRKDSLVDISAFKNISILQGCHLYCVKDCLANTYLQNVIKHDILPSYDMTNICFHLINREEESSEVSSVVSVSKPDYVEKMPFNPLPPKEESKKSKKKKKKKKKKKSKRREETVSSLKHVAPIIDYDDSELDDVLMLVTYVSDHDWEKQSSFDIENLIGTNSENYEVNNCCTISTIHVLSYDDMFDEYTLEDSYSIAYDDYNDEYNIFSSPTIEEEIRYDYNMPPIFDAYGDENSYFGESAPTTIVHVGSINPFMHVAHDRDVLCDSYVINSIHDATESYYERGKPDLMDLNNIKFPLFMLQILKLHLFYLSMFVTMCLVDLFSYKISMHRKWFRFKCVSHLLFDALSSFNFLYGAFALSSFVAPT
jgi:hypothetical protein